jgi:hypothetical protein
MGAYRTVRILSPEEAAYLAGLIDGEGTVTLTAEHPGEKRQIVLSISNTDRDLLEFVQTTIGAGCISGKRTYSERHTPSFAYKLTNRQALDVLAQVASHLRTYRRKRAGMAIERYISVTPRNGKYSETLLRLRSDFEKEFLALGPGPRSALRAQKD